MAGISHYINTAAVEPSRSRTPSLVSTQPQPFPVLFYGDNRPHRFFFHSNGTIEDFSGDASYTLRVTLGDPDAGPFGGTFTLTCGSTTAALDFDSTAQEVEDALNGLAAVAAFGGVDVLGAFPTFLVYARSVGVVTSISGSAALLSPDSSATTTILTTGSASVRQQTQISLRRLAIVSDSTWTPITSPNNGWSGSLTTNTEGAAALIAEYGEDVGGYLQAETLINVEVIDVSSNVVAYYQQTVFLRAKNSDLGSTASAPLAAVYVQNAPSITGLASSVVNPLKLAGLTTLGAIGAGAVFALNFSVTINDGAGTHAGTLTMLYQLQSSTSATSAPGRYRPYDYDGTVNPVSWKLLGAFLDTLPASYNADTGKFHYMGVAGAANACYAYADQTGTAAPA